MQKARVRTPTWMIGVFLMVPLVFGLDINCSQSVSAEDIPEHGKRFRRSAGTEVVGLSGYRQFHANDSLIGQPVPCSYEEKVCFRYNKLYDKSQDWCVDLEKHRANFSSGHLVVADRIKLECDGYVMAYDDTCYRKDIVEDVICGCQMKPTPHFIHGVECRCTPPAPIHVDQPEEVKRCLIPDLRFPDKDLTLFSSNPHQGIQGFTSDHEYLNVTTPLPQFHCSPKQLDCFAKGKVWATAGAEQEPGDCRSLLKKGYCDEGHVVALDVQAAREGRVETTCVPVRGGCEGEEQVRMSFDDKCHSENDIKMITNGKLFRNQFGFFVLTPYNILSLKFLPVKVPSTDMCAINVQRKFKSTPFNVANFPTINKSYTVVTDRPCPSPD